VLGIAPNERVAMAERARQQYLVDLNFFATKMQDLRALVRG
jgi:hypothetical protein